MILLLLVSAVLLAHGAETEPVPPPEPTEPSVPDAVRLYSLDQVAVVYPAGPGEDVEKNRLSAHRRAQYLETVYGVGARDVADNKVGEQERTGNLVLLGWSNRLLGTEQAPRPFARTSSGFAFLGIEHANPQADLMFFCRSPYNPKKFVFFWSRIDPEMERFQVLPFIGSNWAIVNDFLTERQGMFEPGSAWPPRRNLEGEADHSEQLAEIESHRSVRRSEHYDVYYLPGDFPDPDLDAIVQARESAFARAAASLGKPPEGFRIRLFLYRDSEDKEKRTGVPDPAHSIPQRRELYMVPRLARNPSPHEETHVLARQLFGPCYLTSLYEGLALSEDGAYQGRDLDFEGAVLLENEKLPTLESLLQEHSTRALPEGVRFPASGLLVAWLRSLGGLELVKRTYSLSDRGSEGLARGLKKDPASLESAFRGWVQSRANQRRSDLAFLKEQAVAHERYLASDYPGVAAALERALKAKPEDPQTLFNLASAQMRTGVYPEAEKNLKQILALPLAEKDSHLLIFSHYQLGRLYDVQGRRDEAVAEYRRVLEMPDDHDAHRLAEEAIEKPVTKDQLE